MENTIKQNKRTGIVLNRMYVGDYLSDNIGHEVINFFKSDNDGYYIYLNSRGNLAKEHEGKIATMLFVKYHTRGEVEIIGKATGLEEAPGVTSSLSHNLGEENSNLSKSQKEYIENEGNVSYNKASILDIFNGSGQQNIYITYKANAVYRTKKEKHIFIRFSNAETEYVYHNKNDKIIILENYKQAKASLKQYIYSSSYNKDYKQLMDIVNDNELWEKDTVKKVKDEIIMLEKKFNLNKKTSIFDICKIQNDENRISNALAYFMTEYPKLWKNFFKYGICHKYDGKKLYKGEKIDITLNTPWIVERERNTKIENVKSSSGRIDIFISNYENIIVIENKIKSDINTITTDDNDKTQLNRYVNYVDWLIKNNNCQIEPGCHFFILTPNYNIPQISDEMKDKYKIITYRDLYEFLKDKTEVENDQNFKALLEVIHRHTHDNVNDYLYYDMMEKFIRRIKIINNGVSRKSIKE